MRLFLLLVALHITSPCIFGRWIANYFLEFHYLSSCSSFRWATLAQQYIQHSLLGLTHVLPYRRWPKGFLPSGKVTGWKQVYIERALKELGGHTIRINLESSDVKCAVAGRAYLC